MSKFEGLRKGRAGKTFTEEPAKQSDIQISELSETQKSKPLAKSKDPAYTQLTVYIPTELHRRVKSSVALSGMEISSLVEKLLKEWAG